MDLAKFIAARLDEDEAGAWAVHDVSKCDALLYEDLPADAPLPDAANCECAYPARVLREVGAKRAILALHHDCGSGIGRCDDGGHGIDGIGCSDLLYMADVWSDHPDYRDEWKP